MLEVVPCEKSTGPEPMPPMSLTYSEVLGGIGSVMIVELLSAGPPELLAIMVYCATAPGMNFGFVVPFKGSE